MDRPPIDLSGLWRAAPADDELRRRAVTMAFADDAWEPMPVPSHWRTVPAFAAHDGPVIHRTRFECEPGDASTRTWVVFEGIFAQADVWLDGAYLGDPEGYFFPHTLEITDLARLSREHVLAVEVTCTPPRDRTAKRAVTGVFQHWDAMDPTWNPGGLWRPVRLERSGPVRIERLRVVCREVDADRAVVDVHAVYDSDQPRTVQTVLRLDDRVERTVEHAVAQGRNDLQWSFGVDQPRLWWPWSLGEPALATVSASVTVDGVESHRAERRTGLRQVSMRDWVLSVNGERLFVKGANLGPTRAALGDVTADELRRDVLLARDAGLDLVRLHAHVTRPELYDAADEAGMLVWQDFPLQWGYARSVKAQAVRQATEMVDLLAHHPSIVLWCGHNEPLAIDLPADGVVDRRTKMRVAVGQELPTWNRTVLDRAVRRAIVRADDSRPVIAHSGVLPHAPFFDGTDSHLYFGWYHGDERDLPGFAAAVPRQVRFVSEFGAQSVPVDGSFLEPERWPELDWARLQARHGLQLGVFERRVPPHRYSRFREWQAATQQYQADVVRHHVETLRRLKYRPTGGFCVFLLADAQPMVSWSLLGHDRVAKPAYHALVDACRPVIVVADRLPATVAPGDALALDVHVVSDLRGPLTGAEVTARLSWTGGDHGWRWRGEVPADACARIGTISFVVPDTSGHLVLDLELRGDAHTPGGVATNRYDTLIVPG
jgi:beta-mannosidase